MGDATGLLPQALVVGSSADRDFHQWTIDQADLLRSGRLGLIDRERLAEEIEDVGRSEYNALESDLAVLLQHLLKWDHQPARRSRSRELTTREHRRRIGRRLKASPSLVPRLGAAIEDAFRDGRDRALAETGLPDAAIDGTCPYGFDEAMTREVVLPRGREER